MKKKRAGTKLAKLARCRERGEKAYNDMYEAHSFREANFCYRDAKEFFYEAIRPAEELGWAYWMRRITASRSLCL
jgi:hypothetical protein